MNKPDLKSVKLFFEKFFSYLKKYWAILLTVVLIISAVIFAKNKQDAINSLLKQISDINKEHQKDLETMQKTFEEERKRRETIEKTYRETLQRIEADRQTALQNLDKTKKQELKRIVENFHDDPDAMASRINNLFGIEIKK